MATHDEKDDKTITLTERHIEEILEIVREEMTKPYLPGIMPSLAFIYAKGEIAARIACLNLSV